MLKIYHSCEGQEDRNRSLLCKNLKKVTMTAGKLMTIEKNAFKGINKKATITVKGTKKVRTALMKRLK